MASTKYSLCISLFLLLGSSEIFGYGQVLECHSCSSDKLEACSTFEFQGNYLPPKVSCSANEVSCFTKIENGITIRGCLPATNETEPTSAMIKKCSSPLCNSDKVHKELCIHCDSKSEDFCNFYPSGEMMKKCPLSFEPMGCYLFKDNKSNVKRGCVTELDTQIKEVCLREGPTCKKCMGDICNLKRDFQRCRTCDSSGNASCIDKPLTVDEEVCNSYLGECYTLVDNGQVKRSCIGDDVIPRAENCSTSSNCMKCSDKRSCNEEVVFQESCISCDSKTDPNCATNSTSSSTEDCPLMVAPMGCYHRIDPRNGNVKRGCVAHLSDWESNDCDSDNSVCQKCKGTAENPICNSRTSFGKCITCDSIHDHNCAVNPKLVQAKTCQNYLDKCHTFIGTYGVLRGCLSELSRQFEMKCRSNGNKCEICDNNDGSCNTVVVHPEKCIECDSNKDKRCKDLPAGDVLCNRINESKPKGCYTSIVNGSVQRGCVNSLPDKLQRNCEQQSDTCKNCLGENCNKKPNFQKCFDCNSRDRNCAHNNKLTQITTCKEYMSGCVTGIDESGYLHRRCGNINKKAQLPNGYEVCTGDQCNGQIFPEDRLLCHQCDDCDISSNHSSSLSKPQSCNVLSEFDQCYTYFGKDDKIYRGCLTDGTKGRLLCDRNPDDCIRCEGNGCNHGRTKKNSSNKIFPNLTLALILSIFTLCAW